MMNRNDATKDYGIRYDSDMSLFQVTEGGSEYQGIVTARTPGGSETPVSVTVFADDSGALMYQVDTGDLLRLTNMADYELGPSAINRPQLRHREAGHVGGRDVGAAAHTVGLEIQRPIFLGAE
jgi:hypothetical protein